MRSEVWQDVDSINNAPLLAIANKSAHLLQDSEILKQYHHWRSLYLNLELFFSNRIKSKPVLNNISDRDKNRAFQTCKNLANLFDKFR